MHSLKRFFGIVPATNDEAEEMRQAIEAEHVAELQREREKRTHKRVAMSVAVSGVSEDNFFVGFSEDISEGGVFISTLCPPAVGEVVDLSISISSELTLSVQGEVRWHRTNQQCEATGCGVRFRLMGPEQVLALAQALCTIDREPLFFDD